MATMIGERIREARLAQDRSLADVAGKLNISVATLSRIENEKQSVDMGMFLSLAEVLQVPTQQLLGTQDEGERNGVDPIVRRISALGSRERQELWRELSAERRAAHTKKRGSEIRQVAQHVEELLAQVDFLREELESMRKRVKKR
jgi:transcriptional regulator with XRE-family HTH domain